SGAIGKSTPCQDRHQHPFEPQRCRALILALRLCPRIIRRRHRADPGGSQSITMVVIGSPSSSFSGASTRRSANGYSCPCFPPLCFRTASLVLVTLPLSCLSPKHAKTTSPELSLEDAPRVPASRFLPK